MSESYRIVLLDSTEKEIGQVTTIPLAPDDMLVIMPESGALFPLKMCETIAQSLEQRNIKAIVFQVPVQLARLEKV